MQLQWLDLTYCLSHCAGGGGGSLCPPNNTGIPGFSNLHNAWIVKIGEGTGPWWWTPGSTTRVHYFLQFWRSRRYGHTTNCHESIRFLIYWAAYGTKRLSQNFYSLSMIWELLINKLTTLKIHPTQQSLFLLLCRMYLINPFFIFCQSDEKRKNQLSCLFTFYWESKFHIGQKRKKNLS